MIIAFILEILDTHTGADPVDPTTTEDDDLREFYKHFESSIESDSENENLERDVSELKDIREQNEDSLKRAKEGLLEAIFILMHVSKSVHADQEEKKAAEMDKLYKLREKKEAMSKFLSTLETRFEKDENTEHFTEEQKKSLGELLENVRKNLEDIKEVNWGEIV